MKLIDIILEDIDLDEYGSPNKTDEDRINEFKIKFPNWDYTNAEIYDDNKKKKIKNVFCKIHNHYFPEEGRGLGIRVDEHLKGTGCRDCGNKIRGEKIKAALTYGDEKWIKSLSRNEHFKNKVDFSKSKFSYEEPLTNGPLVTKAYCKIHKKNFVPGILGKGIRANTLHQFTNICPICIGDKDFENKAKSKEEWVVKFKSNERNKKYDYTKSKVEYDYTRNNSGTGEAIVKNIFCKVKGLNGKPHGVFAKDGVDADEHSQGYSQCPKCSCETKQNNFIKKSKITHKNKYVYDKVDFCSEPLKRIEGINGEITYERRKVLIGCKVPTHGYFFQRTDAHISGSGCPACRESKGENYIKELLNRLKIKFVIEKKFTETGDKEFDFYIPKNKVLIEYDGEGHFWPVFGDTEYTRNLRYNQNVVSDDIKNNFVRKNKYGLKLIRVPYNMEFSEIDSLLMEAINNTPQNGVNKIGEYPRRHNRKEVVSKFQIGESKLSMFEIVKDIN